MSSAPLFKRPRPRKDIETTVHLIALKARSVAEFSMTSSPAMSRFATQVPAHSLIPQDSPIQAHGDSYKAYYNMRYSIPESR
jgi:hypothetical protein